MTEIEQASKNHTRFKELVSEIEKCREFQMAAKKANDNMLDKIWSDKIKELKQEKHLLDMQNKYIRLSLFIQVTKSLLTKSEFDGAWSKVDEILEHPELLQP